MADSPEHERTESIPSQEMLESSLRAINQWVRANPSIAEEVARLTQSLMMGRSAPFDPSLVETVAIDSGTPRGNSSTVAETGTSSSSAVRFGDYEILSKIAQGGMGVVYQARQTKLNRIVALKRIRTAEFANAEQVRRFYAEAEAAAKLDHPGIVPVYDVGEVDGEHFYSMAFVDGESLSDRVKRDGPLRPQEAVICIREAAAAVQVAHDAGIIHRDIKPQNLLLDRAAQVRVTDFGLAKLQQADSELTREGQVLGTPAYMPPEQASGKQDQVGVPADVYSLGATLYFLLTGRPPFQASTLPETLRQVIENEPVPPRRLDPSIPRDLETICLKTLSKDLSRRYATSQELADDLRRWLAEEPIRARRVGRVERAWKWCKRKPVIAGLSVAIVVGAILGAIVLWERLNASRTAGLVDALASAEPREVPRIITDLDSLTWWAEPMLRAQLATGGDSLVARRVRLHARLALAQHDSKLADMLVEDLLEADLRDVANLRDALKRCASSQMDRLWTVFRGNKSEPRPTDDQRFRAGLALCGLDNQNKDWQSEDYRFLVDQLLETNPVFQPVVWDLLRPMRQPLADPLEAAFIDPARSDTERLGAANALAELATDDRELLTRLLTQATLEQFDVLYPLVSAIPSPKTIAQLSEVAATLPPDELGSVPRIAYGQQRANAAIAMLWLGDREKVFSVFDWTDDPEALTQFIFRCRPRGVGVEALLDLLQRVSEAPQDRYPKDTRYALLLALGEYRLEEIPEANRDALLAQLADWYANDASSGVHGASGWLLRQWGQNEVATKVDQTPMPYSPDREWFTLAIEVQPRKRYEVFSSRMFVPPKTTFYYTFIVFPSGDYTIGSVEDESEETDTDKLRHTVTLTRPFALLDREITFEELVAFSPEYVDYLQQLNADPTDAAAGVHWYDSVAFCRWLGGEMGLPKSDQCYSDPDTLDPDTYPRDPTPEANGAPLDWPLDLGGRGFRLPTEAEWEIAARSRARTVYGYGSDPGLPGRFAWFEENSGKRAHAGRELCPSVRGLFDLHGNVFEWTHDWYEIEASGQSDPVGPSQGTYRVIRGGSWRDDACRSADRNGSSPVLRGINCGFRVALSSPEIPE